MARSYPEIVADIDAAKKRLTPILREVEEIDQLEDPTEGQIQRSGRMTTAAEHLIGELEALRNEQREFLETASGLGSESTSPGGGDSWTTRNGHHGRGDTARTINRRNVRGRALDHIERHAGMLGGDAAEQLTESIQRDEDREDRLADYLLRTGRADYMSAFLKMVRDPDRGHLEFGPAELDAWRDVQELNRAMSIGTGSAGGFLVPYQLDPQIRISGSGSVDPMRALATVRQTVQNELRVVTSAGVTASWDAEAAEVSDDSPTLVQPSITSFKGQAFLPVSYELFEDSDLAQQVAGLMTDAKSQLEAAAFITGTGVGQPEGVITGVVAAAIAGQVLTSAGSALAVADAIAVQNAVPPRFRPNAAWIANLAIINQGVILPKYANGPALVDDSTTPRRMLNWALHEASAMDGTIAAGTTADYVLLAGDFGAGYTITDRIGTTIELIPHLFGASQRPTGQRGFHMHFRTGGKAVIPGAFALMNYSG